MSHSANHMAAKISLAAIKAMLPTGVDTDSPRIFLPSFTVAATDDEAVAVLERLTKPVMCLATSLWGRIVVGTWPVESRYLDTCDTRIVVQDLLAEHLRQLALTDKASVVIRSSVQSCEAGLVVMRAAVDDWLKNYAFVGLEMGCVETDEWCRRHDISACVEFAPARVIRVSDRLWSRRFDQSSDSHFEQAE